MSSSRGPEHFLLTHSQKSSRCIPFLVTIISQLDARLFRALSGKRARGPRKLLPSSPGPDIQTAEKRGGEVSDLSSAPWGEKSTGQDIMDDKVHGGTSQAASDCQANLVDQRSPRPLLKALPLCPACPPRLPPARVAYGAVNAANAPALQEARDCLLCPPRASAKSKDTGRGYGYSANVPESTDDNPAHSARGLGGSRGSAVLGLTRRFAISPPRRYGSRCRQARSHKFCAH